MATIIMERISRLFINVQQVRQVPCMLTEAVPCSTMPGTVPDTEVPPFFRERYIHAGYRPLHRHWRYYFLSLFRRHNETLNIWSHLIGLMAVAVRLRQLAETVDFLADPHSWPLAILVASSAGYMACSATAHLLAGKSELCHYMFFFLDYVGVAQYQYGSAVVHFYYAIEESWYRRVANVFMPAASALCCLSCLGCCYGKYRNFSLPPWVRKVGQVVPSALAYMWDTSPVFQRLLNSWNSQDHGLHHQQDPALFFHCGQISFFLLSAFFFTNPLPERCFPGRCDFIGQGHQLFHVLLVLCTLCQIHASYLDYAGRRQTYTRLHADGQAAVLVGVYAATVVACALIATFMIGKVKRVLDDKVKTK